MALWQLRDPVGSWEHSLYCVPARKKRTGRRRWSRVLSYHNHRPGHTNTTQPVLQRSCQVQCDLDQNFRTLPLSSCYHNPESNVSIRLDLNFGTLAIVVQVQGLSCSTMVAPLKLKTALNKNCNGDLIFLDLCF